MFFEFFNSAIGVLVFLFGCSLQLNTVSETFSFLFYSDTAVRRTREDNNDPHFVEIKQILSQFLIIMYLHFKEKKYKICIINQRASAASVYHEIIEHGGAGGQALTPDKHRHHHHQHRYHGHHNHHHHHHHHRHY